MNLYLTADKIGIQTGGGLVTHHESEALKQLGDCDVISQPNRPGEDVWDADQMVFQRLCSDWEDNKEPYKLVHLYAGTFGKSIRFLKEKHKAKVCYTVAAHDVGHSRKAHEDMGMPFNYPHLTDPKLWKRYAEGYLELADLVICPGTVPAETVRKQGRTGRIEIVPHGCTMPKCEECDGAGKWEFAIDEGDGYSSTEVEGCEHCGGTGIAKIKPFPKTFRAGYMGSTGCDKSLWTLLQAWKKLAYKDAVLVLAGRDSTGDWARHLIKTFGGGNIQLMGWVNEVSEFYNQISMLVVPSATEGFNCEVAECAAHGRPVICSNRAGAVDMIKNEQNGASFDYDGGPDALACLIDYAKNDWNLEWFGKNARETSVGYSWDRVRGMYQKVWKELLA